MAILVFACSCLLAFSSCSVLAYEKISIVNFRKVPNRDAADTSNISFAFEVTPPIQYRDRLTHYIELHWEEEVRGYTGSSSNYYYRSRSYYSETCQEHGNLQINGQTYQFSVSKADLGSGPLYVRLSASFLCNESISRYYRPYCSSSCSSWQFNGQSDILRVDTIRGSIAAFEVDLELWPGEECHEFDMVLPTSTVKSVLLSTIEKNTKAPTTYLYIYRSRYLCIRKNFITMRGVIMKDSDSLATSMRDVLSTWLSEHNSIILGDRVVGIRAGLCGLALSTVNDPVCGSDYPTFARKTPPNNSANTASTPQSESSSRLAQEVDTIKISLVCVCFVSGGLIVVIAILVVCFFYRQKKKKSQRTGSAAVHAFSNVDEEDESGTLVFKEN